MQKMIYIDNKTKEKEFNHKKVETVDTTMRINKRKIVRNNKTIKRASKRNVPNWTNGQALI